MRVDAVGLLGHRSMIGSRLAGMLPGFEIVPLECDITSPSSVRAAVSACAADTILNCAAYTDVESAWRQAGDKEGPCYQVNVGGVAKLAEACSEHGRRLIHLSTEYVFSGDKPAPYTETDPTDAKDWYGLTKALGERAALAKCERVAVVRISTPFQVSSTRKLDVLRKILGRLRAGNRVTMFADSLITPTWTDDVGRGISCLLGESNYTGVIHVCGSTILSPYEFALSVADEFDLPAELVEPASLTTHIANGGRPYAQNLGISNQRLFDLFGFRPASVAEALRSIRAQSTDLEAPSFESRP